MIVKNICWLAFVSIHYFEKKERSSVVLGEVFRQKSEFREMSEKVGYLRLLHGFHFQPIFGWLKIFLFKSLQKPGEINQ